MPMSQNVGIFFYKLMSENLLSFCHLYEFELFPGVILVRNLSQLLSHVCLNKSLVLSSVSLVGVFPISLTVLFLSIFDFVSFGKGTVFLFCFLWVIRVSSVSIAILFVYFLNCCFWTYLLNFLLPTLRASTFSFMFFKSPK